MNPSILDFLNQDEFEERAKQMIDKIKHEADVLNRPVYYGDGKYCYEQWPDGRKYVLLTEGVSLS